jgi:Flp pilus assembly protein TadG
LRERGAVVVEAALVFPILIVLALGVGEYGIAWRDRLTVQTAVRSAARVASSLGNDPQTDYNALQNLQSGLGNISSASVTKIVIYKSTTANGQVPAACLTASQAGICNTYSGANLSAASASFGCGAGDLDIPWCPTTRVVDQGSTNGPDYVGVYVSVSRTYISGLFGKNGYKITDWAVFRLEPQ